MKEKIAISIDKELLQRIDSKVDKKIIRSRSQAFEFFLGKGLDNEMTDTCFILISKKDQHCLLKKVQKKPLITKQLDFLSQNGIKKAVFLTQKSRITGEISNLVIDHDIDASFMFVDARNNGQALINAKDSIRGNIIVMNGNQYLDFNLRNMIEWHNNQKRLATIGIMSSKETSRYGNVVLEGEMVTDFKEKPQRSDTNIVSAGIYVFGQGIKALLTENKIETSLLPKLSDLRQLTGYFINGDYRYLAD